MEGGGRDGWERGLRVQSRSARGPEWREREEDEGEVVPGEVRGGSSLEGAGKERLWRNGSRKGVDGGA